jgi:hypothetical protein
MAKLTPQQQRDRRAKIMLAALGVVLLAVVGFQLPKLLHSGGAHAAAPVLPPTTAGAALAAAPAAASPSIAPSQLRRFNKFAPKDPFKARVTETSPSSGSTPATTTQQTPPKPAAPPKDALTLTMSQTPVVPAAPRVPAALLVVDGKRRIVPLDTPFPAKHPLFTLVAVGANTVWLRLIGGSLANGSQSLKLLRDRKITLVDTTAGVRLVLSLVRPTTAPKPVAPLQAATTTTNGG